MRGQLFGLHIYKEHAKVSTVVNKSYIRTPKTDEKLK